jgi:pimeloyl-ACP methyl ester carboxylesterase
MAGACHTRWMPRAALPTGIELEYETFGSPDDPTLLLVQGFTAQMIGWDDEFCALLAAKGLHVVRFDNRDCGLSTKLDGVSVDLGAVIAAAVAGLPVPDVPYTLSHMADDAFGLLDHLGVDAAHVVGASMGGMIAQTMAIERPSRVASLVSVMSQTGDLTYGQSTPEALVALMTPPPLERGAYLDCSANWAVWASRKYVDLDGIRSRAAVAYDRAFYPEGAPRQLAAIYASGDRSDALRGLTMPTLVIHGRDDTLITPSGGERTAELVPGAHLLLVADMGHDLPAQLWPVLVDAIAGHARRAGGPRWLAA